VEAKKINQLMVAMGRHGIKRLSLKQEGVELQLEREGVSSQYVSRVPQVLSEQNPLRVDFEKRRAHHGIGPHEHEGPSPEPEVAEVKEDATFIVSPMVGTVYYAPSPSDPSFIKPGDKVDENTVVCLVEAMKVMNEVKAGVQGTVAEVLVENAHPVEFGTKLFRVTNS